MPAPEYDQTESVRTVYVVALGLVALLSILAHFGIQRALDVAEEDGWRINRSGRQRMLSQRAAKSALILAREDGPEPRAELATALRELRTAHTALSSSPGNSSALNAAYARLGGQLEQLELAAQELTSRAGSSPTAGELNATLARVLDAERRFLPQMDAVVNRHQAENEARLAHLRGLQRGLLFATLVVLLLEACFVFEPLRRALRTRMRELQRARESAEEAADLKDEFLARISHELRTPLGGVLGTTELLQAGKLDGEQRELVDAAQRSALRLARRIDAVFDLAQVSAGAPPSVEAFDLDAVVTEVVERHRPEADAAGLELSLEVDEALPRRFAGDAVRVARIVEELVANAVKFSERGALRVLVQAAEPASGHSVVIEVEDTGIGIPADRIEDLFLPFRQLDGSTSRRFEGAGVGLALCRASIEGLGGSLRVRSKDGCGSTFRVELPLRVEPDAALPAEPRDDARERDVAAPLAGLRVLAAEDDRVNRRVLAAHLAQLGCEVALVDDGAAAVERATRERFDVVLLDCRMPVLDGYATASRLRELPGYATVPLLAVTAESGDGARRAEAGMDDLLLKPFRREELRALLERWAPRARRTRLSA